MGVYAVTGSASGMGRKVAQKLSDAGHTVIGVDLNKADIVADLSTAEGRRAAIDRVGTVSYFRPDDWPRSVPPRGLLSYLKRFRNFSGSTPVAAPN